MGPSPIILANAANNIVTNAGKTACKKNKLACVGKDKPHLYFEGWPMAILTKLRVIGMIKKYTTNCKNGMPVIITGITVTKPINSVKPTNRMIG